jgi:L-lysine 2,3-aminomutase
VVRQSVRQSDSRDADSVVCVWCRRRSRLNNSVAVFTIKRVDAVLELIRAYLPKHVA